MKCSLPFAISVLVQVLCFQLLPAQAPLPDPASKTAGAVIELGQLPANGQVPKYTKFELLIKMPDLVAASVQAFTDSATVGYLPYSPYPGMNPFDPDDLDVRATFTSPSGRIHHAYGFFYQNFQHTLLNNGQITGASRWELVPDDYNFRVRFAPDEIGEWTCEIDVRLGQRFQSLVAPATLQASPLVFDCISSNDKGYLEPGANHYLRFKDSKESFFGIGCYIGWANHREIPGDPDAYSPNTPGGPAGVRPIEYEDFNLSLADARDGGTNFARLILVPNSWDVEWELLGNYTARMPHAWEFDKVIDYCEQNDIYATVCMAQAGGGDYNFNVENEPCYLCWDQSPYRKYMFPNLPLPIDPTIMVTEEEARRHLKKKFRYIVARWGYCSHIAQWEISSETDLYALTDYATVPGEGRKQYHPYQNRDEKPELRPTTYRFYGQHSPFSWMHEGKTFAEWVEDWHVDLASFLKETMEVRQMITTSYGNYVMSLDSTFFHPYFSTTNHHPYRNSWYNDFHRFKDIRQNFLNDNTQPKRYAKPYYAEEMANAAADHFRLWFTGTEYSGPNFQNDAEFHNAAWAIAFTGAYASHPAIVPGPSYPTIEDWDQKLKLRTYYKENMPGMRAFFEGVDFERFKYRYTALPDPVLPGFPGRFLHQLKMESGVQAMGYIRLSGWYWASADDELNGDSCAYFHDRSWHTYVDDDPYQGAIPQAVSGEPIDLHFSKPGYYTIEWQDTRIPGLVFATETVPTTPTIQGYQARFSLPTLDAPVQNPAHPDYCKTCRPDVVYKVHLEGIAFDSIPGPANQATGYLGYEVFPNPSDGHFQVQIESADERQTTLLVYDVQGKLVHQQEIELIPGQTMIDIAMVSFSAGIYHVRIAGYEKVTKLCLLKE